MSNDEPYDPFCISTFLADSSLFVERFYDYPDWTNAWKVVRPIRIFCSSRCQEVRTHSPEWDLQATERYPRGPNAGSEIFGDHLNTVRRVLRYSCAQCSRHQTFTVLIALGDDPSDQICVMKIGEYPPVEHPISPALQKILGKDRAKPFKKGMTCEKFSYGIGAVAYYRRIVEEVIDGLLDHIAKLVPEEKKDEYSAVLDKAKKEKVAARKIEIIKPQLPASLRPGGKDPLGILHDVLSSGIHELTEQECLDDAKDVREALEVFLELLQAGLDAQERLNDSTQRLLDRQAKRKARKKTAP